MFILKIRTEVKTVSKNNEIMNKHFNTSGGVWII